VRTSDWQGCCTAIARCSAVSASFHPSQYHDSREQYDKQTRTIAESNNFIVLDKYVTEWEAGDRYQSESELERELIQDLRNQGYEFVPDLTSSRRCWPMSGAASDTESGGV
jgi:hypothetical protein